MTDQASTAGVPQGGQARSPAVTSESERAAAGPGGSDPWSIAPAPAAGTAYADYNSVQYPLIARLSCNQGGRR
jgi:hypothetical protein